MIDLETLKAQLGKTREEVIEAIGERLVLSVASTMIEMSMQRR